MEVIVLLITGMYGQLGHGNTEKQSAPKLVEALEGNTVYLLACGNFHTVFSVESSTWMIYNESLEIKNIY